MAAKSCEEQGVYGSLKHCTGKTVYSGIRNKLWFIRKSDIVKWPELGALNGLSPESAAIYDEEAKAPFTLAEAKKWLSIDLAFNKSEPSADVEGEYPNAIFVNKISVAIPDHDEYATAFARRALNDDLVYLFQQRDGKVRVIGAEGFNCVTKPSQKFGKKATDESGTFLEISCEDVCPAPFYYGEIDAEDGKFSGKTGGAVVPSPEVP